MEKNKTLTTEYFEKVYAANDDPWNFKTSKYEAEKYAATLEALPSDFYENVLEIGCSIGILTKMLAEKCTHLLGTDVSEIALDKAKERCKDLKNVTFRKLIFPHDLPDEKYDLIVISEVAYYLSSEDWSSSISTMYGRLKDKAQIILVHWLPEVHDYPQTGDEVHLTFKTEIADRMKNIFNSRAEKYRIDVWEKC